MSDRYLWDRSGEPDALTAKLEAALSGKRARVRDVGARPRPRFDRRVGWAIALLAAAAGLVFWLAGAADEANRATNDGADEPIAVTGQPTDEGAARPLGQAVEGEPAEVIDDGEATKVGADATPTTGH